MLQAYQADLLKEMDEGEETKINDIAELRRAPDLSEPEMSFSLTLKSWG